MLLETLTASILRNTLTRKVASFFNQSWNYYQNESKFNNVYSRNNLSGIKAYIINIDDHEATGTHWITLYVNAENAVSFDSFGAQCILK